MIFDFLIVIIYFVVVVAVAMSGRKGWDISTEEYFLSSRNLRWPSIAISTIATNIQGYQYLGMMGSAYLYGLAQANFEINAIQGLFMAAFIFVPLYLKDRIITITQFIKSRLGETTATAYSIANILLFSTIGLGTAFCWGAYAAESVFTEYLLFVSDNRLVRIGFIVVILGGLSALYTYFGGLSAVVKTDIIQFSILLIGGTVILWISVRELGGWGELYNKTPELMHLHLPNNHPKLPWLGMFGLLLLNINYWCANQSIVQRSLAARSLKEAQIGLMVGGIMKYYMALIIIIPGIALAGILGTDGLPEADQAFTYLVTNYLPTGVRGIILCALFASLMSTVDSLFNSLATLFSIDIYKEYINKDATDAQIVNAGRRTILVTLLSGVIVGIFLAYLKLNNAGEAFTHTLNDIRYYVNCGIVVLICVAAFLLSPNRHLTLFAFLFTVPMQLFIAWAFEDPELNYLIRALVVIGTCFLIVAVPTYINNGARKWKDLLVYDGAVVKTFGWALLASLVILHVVFH